MRESVFSGFSANLGHALSVTDQELERLKNANIDFGKIVKAAAEVDPAKVKEREKAASDGGKGKRKR